MFSPAGTAAGAAAGDAAGAATGIAAVTGAARAVAAAAAVRVALSSAATASLLSLFLGVNFCDRADVVSVASRKAAVASTSTAFVACTEEGVCSVCL